MKDYSKMSNFEINMAVIEINKESRISGEVVKYPHFADGSSVGLYHKDGDYYEWFNYCNNPSDAWPIMKESLIGVTPDEDGVTMRFYGDWTARAHCKNLQFTDKNPLRAAMIVYLMMKDEEK